MNFDDYFAKRNELVIHLLTERPDSNPLPTDLRNTAVGVVCILTAAAIHVWASRVLIDPGYFARTSTFLVAMLCAGASIVVAAKAADSWLAHLKVKTREGSKERTVSRLISADRSIAEKLVAERT